MLNFRIHIYDTSADVVSDADIVIRGRRVSGVDVRWHARTKTAEIRMSSYEKFRMVSQNEISEFCNLVGWCSSPYKEKVEVPIFGNPEVSVAISSNSNDKGISPKVYLTVSVDLNEWSGVWSISNVSSILKRMFKSKRRQCKFSVFNNSNLVDFEVEFFIKGKPKILENVIDECWEKLCGVLKSAADILNESVEDGRIVNYFNFHESVRPYCEQYLIYFTQFLRDLGVSADSEIKEEVGRVMFSVTPRDGAEALHFVREALAVYLTLPSAPDFQNHQPLERGVAVMQLQANIQHLNSQLLIAQSVIQAKDAALEAKNAVIELKDVALSMLRDQLGEEARQSLPAIEGRGKSEGDQKKPDKEELFGGIVALGQAEKMGVKVNLAALFRRIRRRE